MHKKRVLSGIRATGRLHLGNYLGAVKGMLALQGDPAYETLYMVADAHTITTPYSIEELRKNRREIILDYLAAGLDPEKSVIFQQAEVPGHFELAFLFSSVVTIAKMQHLPTFKDKVKQYPDAATMALLNYPILMSADILVYKAGLVPVGIDQDPHLEVAREIARRMNQDFGTDFPEPQRFSIDEEHKYIPSLLADGKMSKSVEGSYINLIDSLETIRERVAKIPTDSGKGRINKKEGTVTEEIIDDFINTEPLQGRGVAALMEFVELFQGKQKREELEAQYNINDPRPALRYKDIKDELAEAIYTYLQPFQKKRKELEADTAYVDKVIKEGAEKARAIASETVKEVKAKMGLS